MKALLGILFVAILSIIVTLQNVQVVQIHAFLWFFELPLALVLALSVIAGIILGILVSIYTFVIKRNKKRSTINREPFVEVSQNDKGNV